MKLTARSFENAAQHYLKRFPASSGHLKRVLARKAYRAEGFNEFNKETLAALIDDTVTTMTNAGLLDDERYARAVTRSLHLSGKSQRVIANKLREKSVDADLIEQCVRDLRGAHPEPDVDAAWTLARKRKLGPYRTDVDLRRERQQKDLAVLARAGFSYGIAKTVIDADEPRD